MKKSRLNSLRKKHQAKLKNRNFLQIATDKTEGFFLDIFETIGLASLVDFYLKKVEAMRYLVFGFSTTIVNILVFALFNTLGLSTIASNTIAWIISVIFAYTTNKYCVFKAKTEGKKDLLREFSSFIDTVKANSLLLGDNRPGTRSLNCNCRCQHYRRKDDDSHQ